MSQTEPSPKPEPPMPRMSGPALIYSIRWLIYDTFRQAVTSRIFWIMLVVSGTCTVFCLGISIDSNLEKRTDDNEYYFKGTNVPYSGTEWQGAKEPQTDKSGRPLVPRSRITLLYGFIQVPGPFRPDAEIVRFIQFVFASFVVGVIGLVLTLIWTAGFVPDFLQPNSASVLLAKPVPRWALIVGKYLGVLAFVAFQICVFFVSTWLALGLRTGIWEYGYLASIPLFLLQFGMVFSFTMLMAVCTRSTIACIFGSILFWLVCWGMNYGRHCVVGMAILDPDVTLGPATTFLTELGYWILPKPTDLFILNELALSAPKFTSTLAAFPPIEQARESGYLIPELSIVTSFVFTIVLLWISARQLSETDY